MTVWVKPTIKGGCFVEFFNQILETAFADYQKTILASLLNSILVVIIALIVHRISRKIIKNTFNRAKRKNKPYINIKKIETASTITLSLLRYFVLIITILIILHLFHVNITSVLAVAGVGGIALGIGAQSLVKDILNGILIWFEEQYVVGDIVTILDLTGTVEDFNLRLTKLRNFNGDLHIIPNSEIHTVTNMSKGFKRSIVDIDVSYHEDIDRVIRIVEEELELAKQSIAGITGDVAVVGIQTLKDYALSIRLCALCEPGDCWSIERQLRKRILSRFKAEGIKVPYQRYILERTDRLPENTP